jgi:hypothetical protein
MSGLGNGTRLTRHRKRHICSIKSRIVLSVWSTIAKVIVGLLLAVSSVLITAVGQSGHESSGIRPLPTFEPHELELKNPDEACSDQCTLQFQSASTSSTNADQSTATAVRRCTRDESLQLLNFLPMSRKGGLTYCRVADLIQVPCQAVSLESANYHTRS